MKPLLKWAGSKAKLVAELSARAPATFRAYFEPFCGSAALFFHLQPRQPDRSVFVLSDANVDLIATYGAIASDPEAVISHLSDLASKHAALGDELYYAQRERWNARVDADRPAERAATFLYLNRCCFNGLFRVNRKGEFNVPVGDYANPKICDPERIRSASQALARATLRSGDYGTILGAETAESPAAWAAPGRGDLVYVDSPYAPVSETANFTSYTSAPFGVREQRALASALQRLVERGCYVMASNADVPLVREIYSGSGFRIDAISRSGSMNSDASKRGRVGEVIIMGGYGCQVSTPRKDLR